MSKWITLLCIFMVCFQGIFSQELDTTFVKKHPLLENRYLLSAGFFVNLKSVKVEVNGSLPSNPIDFGETLGMNRRENTFAFGFDWRFSKELNWNVSLEYFRIFNTQTATLEDQIKWSNTIYPVGVILDSGLQVDLYRIFFGRVISRGEKHELSGGLGIHTMNISSFIQARAYLGDLDYVLDPGKKRVTVLAPVPNIGIKYLYAPNVKWAISARAEWFSLAIGEYSGRLWNLEPAVSFQLNKTFNIGLGYKYFKAKVGVFKNVWEGGSDLLYQGPLFSLRGTF